MNFQIITPPQLRGLPLRPSYLVCGSASGHMPNVRLSHDGEQFHVHKCIGVITQEEIVTPDFQEALYHAHRMWNRS